MARENVFQGEMDPEIAALLGTAEKPNHSESISYKDLFPDPADFETADAQDVDLNAGVFPQITKLFEDIPNAAFDDSNYYKTALSGEGDIAQRVHRILQKFLNTSDPKDRGVIRQQFILAYWDFLGGLARRAPGKLPEPKKFLLRFGIIHPTFINTENRSLFAKFVVENTLNQPVYYLDEWFKAVGTGVIGQSATDEVKAARSSGSNRLQQFLEKAQGKLSGAKDLLKAKDEDRIAQEQFLNERMQYILEHFPTDGLPEINACYSEQQKRAFAEIQEILKNLLKIDHDLDMFFREYYQAEQELIILKDKMEEEGALEVDTGAVDAEFNTVRQMAKMTIGRQGNHFPILVNEYFHSQVMDIGCRENVISTLAWIESIDPEVFCRTYKNRQNRIIPYVVLIPAYGDTGMCWEPFDRFNRATSRGRLAIPMYPKNLQLAVLAAAADLRWQVAKEKASFYWMEEGITGNYYQYFQKMKLKGDVKEAFIADYITWMTKESEGTQRLDKELRGIFWRHIPFAQPIKDKLKSRSYVYQELYQRDVNRSMSDGY